MRHTKKILLALLFLPGWALACSCGPPHSLSERYELSERVAVVYITEAKVVTEEVWGTSFTKEHPEGREISHTEASIVATGKVVEQLKGGRLRTIKLHAMAPENGCYDRLDVGGTYVLFWSGRGASLNACSPQPELMDVPSEILARWRASP